MSDPFRVVFPVTPNVPAINVIPAPDTVKLVEVFAVFLPSMALQPDVSTTMSKVLLLAVLLIPV